MRARFDSKHGCEMTLFVSTAVLQYMPLPVAPLAETRSAVTSAVVWMVGLINQAPSDHCIQTNTTHFNAQIIAVVLLVRNKASLYLLINSVRAL